MASILIGNNRCGWILLKPLSIFNIYMTQKTKDFYDYSTSQLNTALNNLINEGCTIHDTIITKPNTDHKGANGIIVYEEPIGSNNNMFPGSIKM